LYRPPTEEKKDFHTRCHSQSTKELNKDEIVRIVTPEFLDDLRGAVWAAEADGWCSDAEAKKLVDTIDELARALGYSWYPKRQKYA